MNKLGEFDIKSTDICGRRGASSQKNWVARKILRVKEVTNENMNRLIKQRHVKLDVYGSSLYL